MPALTSMTQCVVIGAGIGGLTAASLLLKAGIKVTVLEAQTYLGGSAGTFFHQGYRFDAGATLAGGFSPGGPHARLAEVLNLQWPVQPTDPAWVTHLPDQSVSQWADRARWHAEWVRAFPGTTRRPTQRAKQNTPSAVSRPPKEPSQGCPLPFASVCPAHR